mgnify:CR=1 FL=1
MQLTEQQFYLLLIIVPALVTAIIVYALGSLQRQRIVDQLKQTMSGLEQQIDAQLEQIHEYKTEHALDQQRIENLQSGIQQHLQEQQQLRQKQEQLIEQLHQSQTDYKTLQTEQTKERQHMDEKLQDFDLCTGLLACFPARALFDGFPVFEKTGREGPETIAWLDGSPAEQQAVSMLNQATGNDVRVLVMNDATAHGAADMSRAVVALGYRHGYRGTAVAAVFHLITCFSIGTACAAWPRDVRFCCIAARGFS